MKTQISINDRNIETIVDSGAAISVITEKLRKELGLPITKKSNIACTLANGTKIASLGKIRTEIVIGEMIAPITLDVIESRQKEIIIGNDTLDEWDAVINYKEKTLEVENDEEIVSIPVWYLRETDEPGYESKSETEYETEESEYEPENKRKLYTMKKADKRNNKSDENASEIDISDSDSEDTSESDIEDEQ